MSKPVTGHPIKSITAGGSSNDGHTVHFSFRFEDGNVRTFLMPTRRIGIFFTVLKKLAQMAFDERKERDPSFDQSTITDVGDLMVIQKVIVGNAIKKGKKPLVFLRLEGPSKLTFDLGLDLKSARNLCESLQEEAEKIERGETPRIQ